MTDTPTTTHATATHPTRVDPARCAAYDVLIIAEKKLRWRNLRLDKLMNDIRKEYQQKLGSSWGGQENGLFNMLVTGVVRHWWQLEGVMADMIDRDVKHVSPQAKTILRLGIFQLFHLSEIPDFAAVHTTVNLAQQRHMSKKSVGFVNAILRNVQRKCDANEANPGEYPFPSKEKDPYGYLMSAQALPRWWARRLLDQLPLNQITTLATAQRTPVPLSIRINTLKTTVEQAKQALNDADIEFISADEHSPELIHLTGFHGRPNTLPHFENGWLYIQDLSSAKVAPYLNPQPGETVIDLCSAPGSKTTHLAALMNNEGHLIAIDSKEQRLEILKENVARLGVNTDHFIEIHAINAKHPQQLSRWKDQADKVLVDVPCSGLGTVRKHPEILLNLREKEVLQFPDEQRTILTSALALVKPGGTVVYSTCSIDPIENEGVVDAVLAEHPEFTKTDEQHHFTHADDTSHWDGFYMAKLVRD